MVSRGERLAVAVGATLVSTAIGTIYVWGALSPALYAVSGRGWVEWLCFGARVCVCLIVIVGVFSDGAPYPRDRANTFACLHDTQTLSPFLTPPFPRPFFHTPRTFYLLTVAVYLISGRPIRTFHTTLRTTFSRSTSRWRR